MKPEDAFESISDAVAVLLPWVALSGNCEKNSFLNKFGEYLRSGNIFQIYKIAKQDKRLRNMKQMIRMFRIKLSGERIEK